MSEPVIFLALPHRNDFSAGTMRGVLNATQKHKMVVRERSCSLLPLNFNALWCDALNERQQHGTTHFAMMHCDIAPEPNWIDILLEEQRKCGADILSVVSPMKDERGLTSTAIRHKTTEVLRRFTMREVEKLPITFDAATAGFPDHMLLGNTGLWVCDFTKPWVEQMCFREQDGIINRDGKWIPICLSEDWIFSLDAHRLGLKVWATRAVKLRHKGNFEFPNYTAWGAWATDTEPNTPDFQEVPTQ